MKKLVISSLVIGMLAGPAVASAEEKNLTPEQKRLIAALLTAPKSAPGIGIGVPSGFAASDWQMYASIGGTTTEDRRGKNDYDGSATLGLGIGNPNTYGAFEVQGNIISLTNNGDDSGVGEQGSFSLKYAHPITNTVSASLGAESVVTWGDGLESVDPSVYVAVTKVMTLSSNPFNPYTVSLTAGVGDERFRNKSNNKRQGSVGVFAAGAIALHRQIGFIADYNGNYFSAGFSFVPLKKYPLTVTLSAVNVNSVDAADGGTATGNTEFGGSIGYSW